ncbi:MAG: hypothetical protein ACRDO7_05660 [Nocardioidaceae bacterium]
MVEGRLSWEPDWNRPVATEYLRRLLHALDDVLIERHFARRAVDGLRQARLGEPGDLLDDVATWTRYTEDGYVGNMMNGVACFGNGLIRVALDRGHGIQMLAQDDASPAVVARCVAGFIDETDDLCRTEVLRRPGRVTSMPVSPELCVPRDERRD